jgi:protein TonB
MVRKKIEENRRYPPWARRNGWQGKVVLDFVIRSDGHLGGVEVVESSGHRLLDQVEKEAIQRANPFPPLPREGKKSLQLRVPIVFQLEF